MINGTPALQFRDVVQTRHMYVHSKQHFSQVQSSVPEDIERLCSLFQMHVSESTMNYYLSVM